ncbi:MAG: primosomal protein N' [Eubacteriales bacterium]|nr:primosomal protein N' [Eubacteriales bacterium]
MYADIIIDISHEQLDKTFQYRVPKHLEGCIELGMMVRVPFGNGNRQIFGYVIELGSEAKYDPEKIKEIISIAEEKVHAVKRIIKLAAWLKHQYGSTMNQALKTVIPVKEKVRQKEKKTVALAVTSDEAVLYLETFAKKNARARYRLLEALIRDNVIGFDVIKNKLNITMQTVTALQEMGIITVKTEQILRNPVKNAEVTGRLFKLNEEQQKIADEIKSDYDSGLRKTYLVHGITGSGKTEVYMEIIEHVIMQGKQVIMLIPEIALTFQTVQRFYRRFGNSVSIMNSRMSKGERYDQFLRAMKGEINIMIGPRSALFTPFSNIGLIVIDEEHEGAYKSEQTPKYHAVDTANYIAKESNASVILGSATPSVESYYRACNGEYKLFTMANRAGSGQLPVVYTADLREELKEGNRSIFSRKLQELICDRLKKKQQIMLFLNKRGYAGFISCRSCGHVMKCPHCDVSLTAHRNGRLVCHYCGYEEPVVHNCPKCGSKYISGFRAGTQQVEEMVKRMFPQARTLRMDMDTTSGKEGHEKILAAFANEAADILIGTQMIVKGHDFPNVTLVGILAADMSLYAGDYKASEKTFQLLTQAAGRAGRAGGGGEVVIQTYTPEHYSIAAAASQDYKMFYEQEIAYRKLLLYPPVQNMMTISLSSGNEGALEEAAKAANILVKAEAGKDRLFVIGPANASIYKINDVYSKVIYVRADNYDKLTDIMEKIEKYILGNTLFKNVGVQFDFNN